MKDVRRGTLDEKAQIEPRKADRFSPCQPTQKRLGLVLGPLDIVMTRVKRGSLDFAFNSAELPPGCERLALNFELPEDGSIPDWVQLIPPGQIVAGHDGRTWINDQPQGILTAFQADGRDLPMDWEHSTELQAPQGLPAPAAAWGKEMQALEGGAIQCRFEWTERGRASVASREYRYISPVLIYEIASRRILAISSVGLTNKPNLVLPALNSQTPNQGEKVMWKQLLILLGLAETATEEQAMNAVKKIQRDLQTALNRAETPSLDKFVPRADYDTAIARATNAETKLADRDKADLDKEITSFIDQEIAKPEGGKISPAMREQALANCRQVGLESFKKLLDTMPAIAKPSNLDKKKADADSLALNAEQQKIADMFGNSAEDLKKYGTR